MPNYKYDEDKHVDEVQKYLAGTYGEHYVAKDIQVIDIWESLDSLETTARDTAIKYLCRYGKKAGKNKKDLLKAIHYILLMMYASEKGEGKVDTSRQGTSPINITSVPERTLNISEETYTIRGRMGTLHTHRTLEDAYDEVEKHDSHIRNQ